MFDRKLVLATCVAAATLTASAFARQSTATAAPQAAAAQTTTAAAPSEAAKQTAQEGGTPSWIRPETPEHRHDRLGTAEDPGPDPDPKKQWWRYGRAYTIERFERKWAAYDREDAWVRPMAQVNFAWEIYQQNDRFVWIWAPVDQPEAHGADAGGAEAVPASRYGKGDIEFFEKTRTQFTALTPSANDTTIRFEESSDGLPTTGSWRNSLAVADMNGDGCPDIIAPPQRGAATNAFPSVFLGDCKGHWKYWTEARWPHPLDYGSVVAADFNKDGHMDLAFAVHLTGVYVYMGDGKGNFTEVTEGLPHDYATRRIIITDANNDGYPDLAVVSEGPSVMGIGGSAFGKAIVLLNKDKGKAWEGIDIANPGIKTGGDWMTAGNFNGDRIPDFLLGSVYYGSWDVVFLSKGPKQWAPYPSDGDVVPSRAYYFASAAGRFSSKVRDDAIVSFIRTWAQDLDNRIVPTPPIMELTEVDRIIFGKDGLKRIPLARWSGHEPVSGLAAGDFDGDGNLDIIYTRSHPRQAVILLGDGKGGFTQARVEGLPILDLVNYDIRVADVNGDGKPDVIMMYESGAKTVFAPRDGSIRVYLNRGASKASKPAKAAATK
ncbi:MAG: VCBS repeat-containing protein [Acidobacteriota bacterium]|nr:VCBS repeat-containing protein [Acidobacteriota bacterium]